MTGSDQSLPADIEDLRERTGLSARELEVLAAKIYRKLGVTNRTEATGIAHRLGIVRDLASAT